MEEDTNAESATMPKRNWLGVDDRATPNPYLDLNQLRKQYLSRFPRIKRYLLDETNQITLKIKEE